MPKFTKGPWIVDPAEDLPLAVIADTEEGRGICEITPQDGDGEALANSRLIAAAPTLLALAKQLLATMETPRTRKAGDPWLALQKLILELEG